MLNTLTEALQHSLMVRNKTSHLPRTTTLSNACRVVVSLYDNDRTINISTAMQSTVCSSRTSHAALLLYETRCQKTL